MKRIFLFLATNIAVVLTLTLVSSVLISLLGGTRVVASGFPLELAVVSFVFGFLGAVISLLLSKTIAKVSCGARTIDGSEGEAERWLVSTVEELARQANVATPEVAVYKGRANAFATGAFRNHALVAVSTDIMAQMTKEELRAVLGHEISHVANGDMVTLTLIQGVLNAFVIFSSRILASALSRDSKSSRQSSNGLLYFAFVMFFELVLGLLSSLVVFAFSRHREYAADAGSARLLGSTAPMIAALRRLGCLKPGVLPQSLRAMGIADSKRTSLFSTHPSLHDRIEALENLPPEKVASF